jgi:hypothetical protein
MIELEFPTSVHVEEQFQSPAYSTCQECHRSFHAKCEDQVSLQLCDKCFEALLRPAEAVPTVRVKVLPRGAAGASR